MLQSAAGLPWRAAGCGVARALAAMLPTPALVLMAVPFGLRAASEVAVHPSSGHVILSSRGVPSGSALRTLAVSSPAEAAAAEAADGGAAEAATEASARASESCAPLQDMPVG